jgi:prophage tail gpP-like protein
VRRSNAGFTLASSRIPTSRGRHLAAHAHVDVRMDTYRMSDQHRVSPAEKRGARDAARRGDKVRRRAVGQTMLAGWADQANWLDEATRAHPGPDAAVRFM